MNDSKNARGLLAALLIASAVLFAIGVALEKSAESDEPSAVSAETSESGEAPHSEAEEGNSEEGEVEAAEGAESTHSESKETLLGIDIESPLAVGAGVVLSIALAAFALRSNKKTVLVVIALFALGFALLDGKELFHQLDENRTSLAVLAGVIGVLHLGTAGVAGQLARTEVSP
jgi:hypothetical protein